LLLKLHLFIASLDAQKILFVEVDVVRIRIISFYSFYFYAIRKGFIKFCAKKFDIFISFCFYVNYNTQGLHQNFTKRVM